jgi:hypothetical protein
MNGSIAHAGALRASAGSVAIGRGTRWGSSGDRREPLSVGWVRRRVNGRRDGGRGRSAQGRSAVTTRGRSAVTDRGGGRTCRGSAAEVPRPPADHRPAALEALHPLDPRPGRCGLPRRSRVSARQLGDEPGRQVPSIGGPGFTASHQSWLGQFWASSWYGIRRAEPACSARQADIASAGGEGEHVHATLAGCPGTPAHWLRPASASAIYR